MNEEMSARLREEIEQRLQSSEWDGQTAAAVRRRLERRSRERLAAIAAAALLVVSTMVASPWNWNKEESSWAQEIAESSEESGLLSYYNEESEMLESFPDAQGR